MAKRMATTPSEDVREGHGDESHIPSVSKGTFIDGGGTYVSLTETAISPNKKSGSPSGGEAGGI